MSHSLVTQAFALRSLFPEVTAHLRPTRLVWTGSIQPTPASRTYAAQITYSIPRFPQVRILKPQLNTRPGETLPHVYGDGTLCLHLEHEWTPDMLIAYTILPWTSEWLINYEIWKATGEWYGGGEWPLAPGPDAVKIMSEEAKSPSKIPTTRG